MAVKAPPEAGRIRDHPTLGSTAADGANGAWELASCEPGWRLTLIVSDGVSDPTAAARWEHVSVHAHRLITGRRRSLQRRTPTWREMCHVKALCWDPEDVVVQYHPAASDYINLHPHVLHLWRPVDATIPMPPRSFV